MHLKMKMVGMFLAVSFLSSACGPEESSKSTDDSENGGQSQNQTEIPQESSAFVEAFGATLLISQGSLEIGSTVALSEGSTPAEFSSESAGVYSSKAITLSGKNSKGEMSMSNGPMRLTMTIDSYAEGNKYCVLGKTLVDDPGFIAWHSEIATTNKAVIGPAVIIFETFWFGTFQAIPCTGFTFGEPFVGIQDAVNEIGQ